MQSPMAQSEHKHVGQWRIPSALAALLIVLCVSGASWLIWRWMQRPAVTASAVVVDPPARGAGRRAGGDQPPGRIFKRDDGSIRAFSGTYWLLVSPPNRELSLRCTSGDEWLSKEQQLLLKMSLRWSRGNNSLRGMQFTDPQKQQMKLVSAEPPIPLSATDKTRLDGLVKAWESATDATKPDAQRAVLLALREVAKANLPAAKEAFVANVNKLSTIITPQQLDQYRQLETARRGGNRPSTPNTGRGA